MPYKDKEKQKEFQHQHYLKYKEVYRKGAKRRRLAFKNWIDSLKIECSRCGYNECKQALHFHHPNGDKVFRISTPPNYNKESALVEIEKCTIICANCHAKDHCTR